MLWVVVMSPSEALAFLRAQVEQIEADHTAYEVFPAHFALNGQPCPVRPMGAALKVMAEALAALARPHETREHKYGDESCPCDCCWTSRALVSAAEALQGKGE